MFITETGDNVVYSYSLNDAWNVSSFSYDEANYYLMTLAPNNWYHLIGTYNASNALTIYVNGIQKAVNTTPIPVNIKNITANLYVGAKAGAVTPNRFKWLLDEVKLYNYSLNADDAKVEYNQGKAMVLGSLSSNSDGSASNSAARSYCPPGDTATCNPPVSEWKFDERKDTSFWYKRNGNTANFGDGANGILTAEVNITGLGTLSSNNNLLIGGGANSFSGNLDEVRIYNYARTPAHIKLIYNENAAVRFAPLTGSP